MANEAYWTYRTDTLTPSYADLPDGAFKGTEQQWYSLSPGMRREIIKSFKNNLK